MTVWPTTLRPTCCGGGSRSAAPPSRSWSWAGAARVGGGAAHRCWRFHCVCSARRLTLNLWVGYFPTVQTAWDQLTAGPLPDQTDAASVNALAAAGIQPTHGSVVPVTIPEEASHFKHRGEVVYLPPAWFSSTPPPQLPTVMMIGGEFNTPADWLRAGNAVKTIDDLAATHGGNAPVFVFVDSGGAFNNDTECVNGSRGNAADHLTKDVVPYMISRVRCQPRVSALGHRGLVHGRHLCAGSHGHASGAVQLLRRHRRQPGPGRRNQGSDRRSAFQRQHRRVGRLRSDDRHHQTWSIQRGLGVVRHFVEQPPEASSRSLGDRCRRGRTGSVSTLSKTRTTRRSRPSRCVNSAAPTASTARSWRSRASTTGLSRAMLSPRRCPGWPAGWARPGCRGLRCHSLRLLPRLRLRRRTPSLSAGSVMNHA